MRRVDRDHQRLAEARIALIQMAPGVDGAVARVPQHLSSDPGLIYERLRWRRRKALDESAVALLADVPARSEEHTSELQSLMRISYAVFCLKKKKQNTTT